VKPKSGRKERKKEREKGVVKKRKVKGEKERERV
jgi:hypothetical protein